MAEPLPVTGREGLPAGNLRLADVFALARSLSDTVVGRAEAAAARAGQAISCRKGCAACCRQLIPVSEAESFALRDHHLARSPEARTRFEERLLSHWTRVGSSPSGPSLLHDPGRYFAEGLDCPYLEAEACSIHPGRPLACRGHLAVSAPAHCSAFPSHAIRTLPISPSVAEALIAACAQLLGRAPVRIPLTSALAWAEAHAEDAERTWPRAEVLDALAGALGAPVGDFLEGSPGESVPPADTSGPPDAGISRRAASASIL